MSQERHETETALEKLNADSINTLPKFKWHPEKGPFVYSYEDKNTGQTKFANSDYHERQHQEFIDYKATRRAEAEKVLNERRAKLKHASHAELKEMSGDIPLLGLDARGQVIDHTSPAIAARAVATGRSFQEQMREAERARQFAANNPGKPLPPDHPPTSGTDTRRHLAQWWQRGHLVIDLEVDKRLRARGIREKRAPQLPQPRNGRSKF